MMRVFLLFSLLVVLPVFSQDWSSLMGLQDRAVQENIKTPEDVDNLQFFREQYAKNLHLSAASRTIPNVMHFIWLGQAAMSKAVVKNINSWIQRHPGWVCKLWTERDRAEVAAVDRLVQVRIEQAAFLELRNCFLNAPHLAEKADLLRYQILFNEGGVVVDLGLHCSDSLTELNQSFDFYCGMEKLRTPITSSSVMVSNDVIAAAPNHPIIKECLQRIPVDWDAVGGFYPGADAQNAKIRIVYRTQSVLNSAVKRHLQNIPNVVQQVVNGNAGAASSQLLNHVRYNGTGSIVLPVGYFDQAGAKLGLFAQRTLPNPTLVDGTTVQHRINRKLHEMATASSALSIINYVVLGLNLFAFCILFLIVKRRRHAVH